MLTRLKATSPAWKQALSTDEDWVNYRREFVIGLAENGVTTIEQVERGLAKARASQTPWLPSVGQFVKWCKPVYADYGLLDAETAYRMAALRDWSGPEIVYLAAEKVGVYEVATKPEKVVKPRYVEAYTALADRVLAGEKLERPIGHSIGVKRDLLEDKPVTPKEGQKARLEALRMLGLSPDPTKRVKDVIRDGENGPAIDKLYSR